MTDGETTTKAIGGGGINVDTFIHRIVCFMIVLGVTLTYFVSEYFLFLLLFVAANFFQSTFSWGICVMSIAVHKLGWVVVVVTPRRVDDGPSVVDEERVYLFGIGKPPASTSSTDSDLSKV